MQASQSQSPLPTQPSSNRLGKLLALGIPAVALAVAIGLMIAKPPDALRLQGGSFKVFATRPGEDGPREVVNHQVKAGDSLSFSYEPPRDGYLVLFQVDSNGKAIPIHPREGGQSQPVKAGPASALPESLVVDASPGGLWLMAVFSFDPLPIEPLVRQLDKRKRDAPLRLECSPCRVDTVRLEKLP